MNVNMKEKFEMKVELMKIVKCGTKFRTIK